MTSINLLPISPKLRTELLHLGLSSSREIVNLSSEKLAQGLKLSVCDAKAVQEHVKTACTFAEEPKSVASLLVLETSRRPLVTMCKSFDDMLGGGIPLGRLTEICGAPGVGKTQFCFQLCSNAQIPTFLSGLDADALFVDTEGSFMAKRMSQIAAATLKHLRSIALRGGLKEDDVARVNSTTVEDVMERIKYIRCADHIQLLALSFRLREMTSKSRIRLVIIDSIAFPFRYNLSDTILRNRFLATVAQNLMNVLQAGNVAVVLTNQMTTRFDDDDEGYLTPALGDSWAHVSAIRVLLEKAERHKRTARLVKHPSRPCPAVSNYQVTLGGIRDFLNS